jgi:hypothetical protein
MALANISEILAVIAAQTCVFRVKTSSVSGSDLGVPPIS